ncbi:M48 family metalloprotease [Streptomyces sp. ISL-11]|uniref:M48 family metalloprotease n=1 Tax=Streptomyces sp. ISL-11 TaxID=2819174 RepID=UPI001BEB4E76|nr:M48 family metalloprotease [Streptomyces sp. ISL-11]MBT2387301.1 M48 family metalloprotease [Streptomyces sp. ISL-11]
MIALLLLPLLLPIALPPLARRVVGKVRPDIALWTVTLASAALATGVLACLGALLLPLALMVPSLAALAELVRPVEAGPATLVELASALATGALAVAAAAVVRAAVREAGRLRSVRADLVGHPEAGGLCVVEDDRADAYALPGTGSRPGRVVVTTGMLRVLTPAQREALLAHERAHLAGRHHVFLLVGGLAARCHPALCPVAATISLAAERAADEAAAAVGGDRTVTAHAIGRAALATGRSRAPRPASAPGAGTGPVPARVKALLAAAPVRRITPVVLAMALLCGTAAASSLAGAASLHHRVEIAQGERPGDPGPPPGRP